MSLLRRAIEQIKPIKRPPMPLPIRRPGRPRPLPLRPRPRPMPLPMVPPPGLPIRTGGLGELAPIRFGVSPTQDSGRGGLKGVFDNLQKFIAQNPDKVRQGGGFLGKKVKRFDEIPLEDRGFGPGIRRSEDFFRPEGLTNDVGGKVESNRAPITDPNEFTAGTLGGSGYGRFPLGTGGPEYLYDDAGNPIMDPSGSTFPNPIIEPTPTMPSVEPTQTTNMQPINVSNQDPFAASVTQVASGLDPLTEQLLFGLGGKGGFIPGAMRAAEKVFFDEQGNPIVIDEQVAGFSPDQLQAMQMQRQALGIQNPFLMGAGEAFGAGTQALEEGLQRGRTAAIGALEATRGGVGSLQTGLGESADILRGTLGGYDPSMTQQFYDPFEDRVVQQTIEDIMEQGAKSDIGARASDIARGGESAFGSRARLGASERQEALGRGLAEALSGIRSRGFQQAQQTGLGEFARQKAAERAASSGLASLAGQGFGGSQALAGALSGLGQTEQDIGQQRFSGQFGLGTSLQGLGAQAAGASASDIAALYGMGSQQQQQTQQMLDAQRRNLQQRQMTPLLQYQALQPFVGMAPAGQFQTTTQFAPPPSPMQAGLGVGLSAFGALGQLYGGGK